MARVWQKFSYPHPSYPSFDDAKPIEPASEYEHLPPELCEAASVTFVDFLSEGVPIRGWFPRASIGQGATHVWVEPKNVSKEAV